MSTVPAKVKKLAEDLESKERIRFLHTDNWRNVVPSVPGVYVIWRNKGKCTPIYIGETVNLFERFSDLHRTANHTFRRHVLRNRHNKGELVKGVELSKYISRNFNISYIPILMGRVEVEEYLIYKWRSKGVKLYNKMQKRLYKNTLYRDT